MLGNLQLKIGAGEVCANNLNISKKMKIDGGAGRTEIKNSEVYNLKADLGIGEFIFSGKLVDDSDINSGVGTIEIDLEDDIDNYTIKASKGIGSIIIDGEDIDKDKTYGDGENYIKIDGGVGTIKIK